MSAAILRFVSLLLALALQPAAVLAQTDTTNTWFSNGPAGRVQVLDVKIDPQFPDTLYAGTFPGTVFRSLNRGGSWTEVGAAIVDTVSALAINPKNSAVIYAGTLHRGVYKTTNRGTSWSAVNTGLADRLINAVAVDPADTNRVFAGSSDSLFVSTNGGASWATAGLPNVVVSDIAFNPQGPDTVYVGTDGGGVYRTLNGGTTWAQANAGLGSLRISALAVHPARPDTVYATTFDAGLFRSVNGAATWAASGNGLTVSNLVSLAIAPGNPSVLYAGSGTPVAVFKSADNAETWSNITRNLPSAIGVEVLAVRPDSANVVYAAVNNVQRLKQTGLDSIRFLQAGPLPRALAGADLDGDGDLDLVAGNAGSNTLSVFLTRSQGALFQRRDYRAGSGPASVRAADLDGDGDLDLASANRTKRTVSVLFNNGAGAFSLPVDFFVGEPATLLALADVDRDQDTDIVAGDNAGGTVRIYLNDGRGSFSAPGLHPVAPGLSGLAAADFTGNGLPDLAVLSRTEGNLRLLINLGNTNFAAGAPVVAGAGPAHLVSADFDLDGYVDLAVATLDKKVLLFRNDGSGDVLAVSTTALADTVTGLAAADLDGDGYTDLLAPRGDGTVAGLINNGNAAFTATLTFGTLPRTGGALAVDLNGDGRREVVVTRPDAEGLVIYANNTPKSIKAPPAPRNLTAADRGGDLGGNIDLTWDRALADETTGRIVAYRVFRAAGKAGPYGQVARLDTSAAHTQDSTVVFRSYTDSSATVGATFYYYVVSENASQAISTPSDTVSAASSAQPFFDFLFSGNSPFHIRDTIAVTVRLNPVGQDIQSFSLFLDYAPRAFTLLDGDPAASGLQPFAVDSVLASEARVLQNRLEVGGKGQISYGVGFLPAFPDAPIRLGTVRFVALRDTVAQIRVVRDPTSIRQSALTARADGSVIQPYIPPPSTLVLRNHRIRGTVTFQGRTNNPELDARFDLTQADSLGTGPALPDSLAYRPPNDMDLMKPGVQMRLNPDGSFSLVQVRGGKYGLFVKTFHYLRGRVATDSIRVNDSTGVADPVSFEWISSDSSVISSQLRAGDANDDNRADLADFGILSARFGASGFARGSPAWGADFNGDGVVNLADFALLQSNFGERGMGPAIAAKPALAEARFVFLQDEGGGQGAVRIEGAREIAGFALDLVLPAPAGFSPGLISPGGFLNLRGQPPMLLVREMRRKDEAIFRIAAVMRDAAGGVSGNGDLLYLARPGAEGPEGLRLENTQVLLADGTVAFAGSAPHPSAERPGDQPARPGLFQNLPNPFNPATTIPFAVSEPADVRLAVYSVLGQEVRTLVRETMQPGYHRVTWDGRDDQGRAVASGVYLYRVQIGGFVDVKKAVLLR